MIKLNKIFCSTKKTPVLKNVKDGTRSNISDKTGFYTIGQNADFLKTPLCLKARGFRKSVKRKSVIFGRNVTSLTGRESTNYYSLNLPLN